MQQTLEMQQSTPWWKTLPDDYYRHAVPTHLDRKSPLKVHGSAAMDRVLRTGLAAMVSSALTPLLAFPEIRRRELDAVAFYGDLAALGDPSRVFMAPPDQPDITPAKAPWLGYRPSTPYYNGCFSSAYEPLNPDVRDSYLSHAANREVSFQHWTHPGGPRPTMIFIHIGSYQLNGT